MPATAAPPPTGPIDLRLATVDDALCLGVLGLQVFLDTYATGGIRPSVAREVLGAFSTDSMRLQLLQPDARMVVAERDGHLVGFMQLRLQVPQALVQARRPAELERLYVQQPFMRQGLGSALLQRAEQLATSAGADGLWLTAWVHNQRARAFYAHHGYADLGQAWYRFEGETHENRVLAKPLARPLPARARPPAAGGGITPA